MTYVTLFLLIFIAGMLVVIGTTFAKAADIIIAELKKLNGGK